MSTPNAPKDTCWNCSGVGHKEHKAGVGQYADTWWPHEADTYKVTCVVCLGSGMSYPKPTPEEIAEEEERRWSHGDADADYYEYEGDVA